MIKLGVIGCGGMGAYHTRYLRQIPAAEVIAAADIKEKALEKYQQDFGIAGTYTDWAEMLSVEKLDAVIVCLPTFLHYEVVIKAAVKGINIFCEKPLARTLTHGKEMIQVCKEKGVMLTVGFVRRFDNFWGKAKEVIESGVLGKPVIWRDIAISGPRLVSWYFDEEKGGGPILDGMIHNFDFGNFIFGNVVKVVSGLTQFKKSTAIDTGAVWVEYESGNIMSNFWSWGMPEGVGAFGGMDMIGPDGVLVFPGGFDPQEFSSSFDAKKEGLFLLRKRGGGTEPIVYEKNDMFLNQMKSFVDCLKNNKEPCVTGEDGQAALRVALAALQEEKI